MGCNQTFDIDETRVGGGGGGGGVWSYPLPQQIFLKSRSSETLFSVFSIRFSLEKAMSFNWGLFSYVNIFCFLFWVKAVSCLMLAVAKVFIHIKLVVF